MSNTTLKLVTDTFKHAVIKLQAAVVAALATDENKSQEACRTYAIGYLAGMTKTQVYEQAAKLGFTDLQGHFTDGWDTAKGLLSQAHRSIAGEFGFGEKLAVMWANGDFSIKLYKAYAASAGPRKVQDKVKQAVKLLCSMGEAERQDVYSQVEEAKDRYNLWQEGSIERFESLTKVA